MIVPMEPAGVRSHRFAFGVDRTAPGVREARRRITDALADRLSAERLTDVRLLVSEVVSNAVQSSNGKEEDRVVIEVELRTTAVRVRVASPGAGFQLAAPLDVAEPRNWGLTFVDGLARSWGVERVPRTVVWFELSRT
jgi:anti-sigma regulatory factor (Ser/Thr protein kinase)